MSRSQDIFFSAKQNGILAVEIILAIGIVHHASEKALVPAPSLSRPNFLHFHEVFGRIID